jgi:hypothetical protein
MPIDFTPQRWEKVKQDYAAWWAGKLDRPLIRMILTGADPGRPKPKLPVYGFTSHYDLAVPAEQIIDRLDYEAARCKYLADAFPWIWPNFGPGVVAALLGADLVNSPQEGTVWFKPSVEKDIKDLSFSFTTDTVWFKRIRDIMQAGLDRWNGMVQVAMTDLGGNLDVLSSFRPSEKLLFDLYDNPDQVQRLVWEAHNAWWAFFDEFNKTLFPQNPGYSSWAPLFSTEPFYMLQCDFCYMISPAMFDQFVKPELAATCKKLTHAFYHLDGPGQLPHLDSLLAIDELKGVQWVPGERRPELSDWLEVYKKISAAGKKMQIWGSLETVDKIIDSVGDGRGIIATLQFDISQEKRVEKWLAKYGAL